MAFADTLRALSGPLIAGRAPTELLDAWRSSLMGCLPAPLRRELAQRDRHLIIAPRGPVATLAVMQGGETLDLGALDTQAPGALTAILSGVRRDVRRTIVQLPAAEVLRREVSFPEQVRTNLRQVVGYEIDRLSPFQAAQVYYDFRIAEGVARGGKLRVELALCRRDLADDWLRRLREAGVPADRLSWEGAWPKANLLPAEERPRRRARLVTPARLLLLLVLVLIAAVLVSPLWQKQRQLESLDTQLGTLRASAAEVEEVRAALERAREGSTLVLQRKIDQPRSVDLLRELTERLPDDTWVQNLDVTEREVQIRGESAQATALIGLLEKAPGFSGVSFRSPVVQVATTGQERFHIAFRFQPPEPP
ncbi:MAG: PilN domain-containing protein [Chromatiaceae bacterium]|jgi:general secretion pathway protein L|nr:PilN domain-containing protein [Chromatiaceae bacterium]